MNFKYFASLFPILTFRRNVLYSPDLIFLLISCSAHQKTNFMNPEFQFPQFRVFQSVFIFLSKELYWHFWVYFDNNLKLLPGKNTQKVNKQKICCKNLGFVIDSSMS